MANTWLTNDKLFLKYGPTLAVPNVAGEEDLDGPLHCISIKLDLTKVTATDGSYYVSDQVFLPKNARIAQVDVVVQTAATGTNAVLNLGLVNTDRATEIDYNGLIAALPVTSMTPAGTTTRLNTGSTYAGALIGATNSTVGYIVADYDTAAFTAGVVYIRVYYYFNA